MTHVTWISGWGVAPEGLRAAAISTLPDADHRCRPPAADALSELGPCDILAGWSLGAWRILEAASRGFKFEGRILLLAPFIAFGSEYGLGGKCSLTQVRWLRRWLERDPEAALKDFYARAGLDGGMPYAGNHLLEGLDHLAQDATPELRAFVAKGLPSNFSAVVGEFDPLLNAEIICQLIPGCRVVKGARHRFEDLVGPALDKEPYAI